MLWLLTSFKEECGAVGLTGSWHSSYQFAVYPLARCCLSLGLNLLIDKMKQLGASLVAQWLRICLPMQGTWVRALVWEDLTCHGATRPVSHNY